MEVHLLLFYKYYIPIKFPCNYREFGDELIYKVCTHFIEIEVNFSNIVMKLFKITVLLSLFEIRD